MTLTIVRFKAFDKELAEAFINKTFEQIHTSLHGKCFTYEVIKVTSCEVTELDLVDVTMDFNNK